MWPRAANVIDILTDVILVWSVSSASNGKAVSTGHEDYRKLPPVAVMGYPDVAMKSRLRVPSNDPVHRVMVKRSKVERASRGLHHVCAFLLVAENN